MGRINYTRVLLGGLLAGVVVNVSEFVLNGVILMDDYQAVMDEFGLTEADWAMTGYIVSAFILGLVIAWVYAAIRPRFGPGWKTGAIAGAAVWGACYLVPAFWFGAMGLTFGMGLTLLALTWGLVEMMLAGMAGGWIYQEEAGQPAPAAQSAPAEPSRPAATDEPAGGQGHTGL